MNEILTVNVRIDNDLIVTDSRNVAGVFNKRHDNVLRDINSLKKDVLNFEEMFYESEMPDSYGRLQKVYLMNRDGFTLLAMGFTGKEAMEWKLKYINAFNAMEAELNSPEQLMARALKVADMTIANLKIENKQLLTDNERMKPKEEFFDAVTDSKDAIEMKDVSDVLNFPGIGRNNLFKFLRDQKILTRNNQPYQEYIDRGYFRVVEQKYDKPYGETGVNIKTLVFQRGVDFIRKQLNKHFNNGQYELGV